MKVMVLWSWLLDQRFILQLLLVNSTWAEFCFVSGFLSHFRKDDWPDKRMAMDDRYGRSDFPRQDRYQDFDHRDRGRYQDNMGMDRRDNSRGMGSDRDGQVCRKATAHVKFPFVPRWRLAAVI